MTMVEQLLKVCDLYCVAVRISRARLSTVLFSRGTRLDDIGSGADIGARLLESKLQWLSDNWPEGADWPEGVSRPALRQEAGE